MLSMTPEEIMEMALQSVKKVLTDEKAPATALASASATAARIAEFERTNRPANKEPSEMTYDELQAAIGRSRYALEGAEGEGESE